MKTNVFSTRGARHKNGSLLTTITATTGARNTQIKWSSVESQHLMEREEEIYLLCKQNSFSLQSLKSLR